MSKRLQVLIEPREYRTFHQLAREAGVSLGEWVRRLLRREAGEKSLRRPEEKLRVIRKACQYNGPTGDIGQILQEIEKGYLQ